MGSWGAAKAIDRGTHVAEDGGTYDYGVHHELGAPWNDVCLRAQTAVTVFTLASGKGTGQRPSRICLGEASATLTRSGTDRSEGARAPYR